MPLSVILKKLLSNPLGFACIAVLFVLYTCALFAPLLAPYNASLQNLQKSYHPPTALFLENGKLHSKVYQKTDPLTGRYQVIPGTSIPLQLWAKSEPYKLFGFIPMQHRLWGLETENTNDRFYLLGSDSTGRDVFSRLLYGAQVSLSIGVIGISITFIVGFLVGALSGYFGGRFDFIAMRSVEFLMAVPTFYLLLALRSAIAPYFTSGQMFLMIVIILAFIGWSGAARIIRGMVLSISQRQFVVAAEAMGQSTFKILYKHILPNIISYLLVAATLSIPGYVLGEAALSFLGLGIQEPSASWGLMLSQAQQMRVFMLNFWWLLTPGIAIFITVVAFNILGDILRDIVDPKMKI